MNSGKEVLTAQTDTGSICPKIINCPNIGILGRCIGEELKPPFKMRPEEYCEFIIKRRTVDTMVVKRMPRSRR